MPLTRTRPSRVPRTPQQARSRRTRQRILEAAVACFEETGFEETTTTEIARRAGLAVGSLYGYFHDKRAILLELLHGTVEEVADLVVRELDPEHWRGPDLRPPVRGLVHRIVHAQTIRPGVQRILWERFFKDPDFRAVFLRIETRVRHALESLLTRLRAEGRVRVADPATAAFLIQTAIQWMTVRLTLGDAEVDADAAMDGAAELVSRFLFENPEVTQAP
jgi:AcrR family transcriptional regulator